VSVERTFGHGAVVKRELRITRILWNYCSFGCLFYAVVYWSLGCLLLVGRCMDPGFGHGQVCSHSGIGSVFPGVVYSGFSVEFRQSSVRFCYEPWFRMCPLRFWLFTGTFWDKLSLEFRAE